MSAPTQLPDDAMAHPDEPTEDVDVCPPRRERAASVEDGATGMQRAIEGAEDGPEDVASGDDPATLTRDRVDSQVLFDKKDQTIVLWDFDDTLCPSHIARLRNLTTTKEVIPEDLREEFRDVDERAVWALRTSSDFGHTVIVTNAEQGWIEMASAWWLPKLFAELQKYTVVSARTKFESADNRSPASWKEKAFEDVISQFYSRYPQQRWKNVVSIGDSTHERMALRRCTEGHLDKGCRRKCVKFIPKPKASQVARQLEMVSQCLQQLVKHNDHLDLQITVD